MNIIVFRIPNMACDGCAKRVRRILREKGVSNIRIDLKTKAVEVYYYPERVSRGEIIEAIKKGGFVVE